LFYAFFPAFVSSGPLPATLARWDELLGTGFKVVGVGGSDAHALHMHLGPLHRTIFPYEFHFRGVNTHILSSQPLTGDALVDRRIIYEELAEGRCFIGYDLAGDTRGFRFSAQGRDNRAVIMGGDIPAQGGVTLQARLPGIAEIRLIKDGMLLKTWGTQMACTHITTAPGVYRIEAYKNYLGKKRGWIFSNPIYLS
jgi:hypothetical protein